MAISMSGRLLPLVLVSAALAGACGSESSPTPSDGQAAAAAAGYATKDVNGSDAAAEALASIHEQSPVVKKTLIRRYAEALDRLEPFCRESQRRLADFAVYSAWQLERQSGISTTPLEVLDRAAEFARGAVTPMRCRTAFDVTVGSWDE